MDRELEWAFEILRRKLGPDLVVEVKDRRFEYADWIDFGLCWREQRK